MEASIRAQENTRASLWRTLSGYRIGPLPLPVYAAIAAITLLAALNKKLPDDMIGGLAVLMLLGFLLGEIGARLPVFKHIGGAAILCLFVPSALVGYKVIDPEMLKALTTTMKTANLQYLYIACLVAGSILGMSHRVLVQGFMRMFIPLLIGTLAAIVAGVTVGLFFGYDPKHTFFFIVIPIVGGGIGEGILPLSIGYSEILGRPQAELIAMLVPAALLGNVVAILSSGVLKSVGGKRPHLTGHGDLVKSGNDADLLANDRTDAPLNLGLMGAGLLISCAFFIFGALLSHFTGIPGPILMIVSAALLKVSKVLPQNMELGAYQMYKFVSTNLTFAILVGLGALFVSWKELLAAFTPGYFAICAATVLALVASGFFVGKWLGMYPVESGIVTACHSGLGGTGDVAILSASNRMGLMPFAQISTRIGGAAMVVAATILLKVLH
ncbi:2-hydroxycarboxylate transporter family protein [Ralstonia flatus]|uniref:Citrate/malate transporter n=1 Tax=Ralstonia flatus TaxID=3058601 RepID=A0AAD2C017_9RALS|nr:2-hydroxycarboxylate transporter family protein [Ralstonia sp. LMG 32965]MBN6211475.1 2-hydroxycarboxylate transporter family protein [Ralstonia pickettii]CAJ0862592.1 Citrate/malate transporter [Ralstonia sp. LMG 32965]CAJ0869983.1 Citrate/malate transporter [Ralstonia sp. LMG 32965]